jgi:phage-related protein
MIGAARRRLSIPGAQLGHNSELAKPDGVTCFLQNSVHLKAAPLREICHIGHRREMASLGDKPLVWLKGEVKTPPFGNRARLEAGLLLRRLQQGQGLSLPHSRPMPAIGRQCHELRISDHDQTWRIVYHVAPDAIVILDVFSKKTPATPGQIVVVCQKRLAAYLQAISDKEYT